MQLLTLQDLNLTNLGRKFKQSPLAQLVATVIFVSLAAGMFCWYRLGELPGIIAVFSGGFLLLIGLICFTTFMKSLAPTNWVMAVGPNRVLIKFRSYLNAHFPATDPQVVQLSPSEIKFANITKQTITTPGSDHHNVTSFHTFLDLHIASGDLAALKNWLKYERTVKVTSGKAIKTSSRSRHYPVSVVDNRIIRVEWRSPQDVVVPGIKKAIALLARHNISIAALNKEVLDLTDNSEKGQRRMDDKILLLAERGNLMAAAKLARRAYKLSLTEAKQFVEDLLE